jgi:phosphatidylglycerol---prolipoprotein diacylglyceryl transferase
MAPFLHLGPYTFFSFGLAIGVGIVCSTLALQAYFRSHGLQVNVLLFTSVVVPFGFLCARFDSMMFESVPGRFGSGFASRFSHGGLTYFGGFVGATLAFMLLMRLYRLPWLRTLDALFCVGPAYAIGRIGCFLAGDGDYGIRSTLPWAVSFPHGIVPTLDRVHPTMLYSTVWELAVFAALWKVSTAHRRTPLRPGILLGLYLIATSVGRFFIEFLSRNRAIVFGLTEAQLVSVALFLAGTAIVVFASMKEAEVSSHITGKIQAESGRVPAETLT